MKMEKRERGDGVGYAKKEAYEWEGTKYEADLQNGDKVTIKDAGIVETHPEYGAQHKFLVETRNGDKRATFNKTSINVLVDEFGEESEDWIGKKVNVLTKKGVFGNTKGIACYFVTDGYSLDDYGELVKEGDDDPDTEHSIDSDDIPF